MNLFDENNGMPKWLVEDVTPQANYLHVDQDGMQSYPWTTTTYVIEKSPRERLLEEIMVKARAALQENNLDRVRELLEIGNMLKEI